MVREDRLDGSTGRGAVDFDEIYRQHFPYVWRTLRRLGVAPADVEDVAHEVFVVVHRRLADLVVSAPSSRGCSASRFAWPPRTGGAHGVGSGSSIAGSRT